MYPHRIRLRGPWECEPLGEDAPPARRVSMPCRVIEAGLGGFRGHVRFTRKFGYPGRADRDLEHIWLTCDGCTGCGEVRLNGQLLSASAGDSFQFDVTTILTDRNQLDVMIEGATDDAGLWGEVAMEIRKDAYLSAVQAQRTGPLLVVTGSVVGVSSRPLELYTLVDGRHVDYRTIEPTAAGTSFRVAVDELPSDARIVRVELIHISEIWYVVECEIR